MSQTTLKAPLYPNAPFNTGDSGELGDRPKAIIDAMNTMFAELYAVVAGFSVAAAAVTVDRPVKLATYTVATAPDAATAGAGAMIYVSDGAAGSPIVAFSNGTDWLRCDTAAAIAAA